LGDAWIAVEDQECAEAECRNQDQAEGPAEQLDHSTNVRVESGWSAADVPPMVSVQVKECLLVMRVLASASKAPIVR
jgi:hypothetical protein